MKDITNNKYGRLTAIVFDHIHKTDSGRNVYYWRCKCDCGNEVVVSKSDLASGHTKSCGCLRKEMLYERSIKHGDNAYLKRSRLYSIWSGIKSRCGNPNQRSYADYGARGIYVCDEWKDDYEAFKNWAVNNGYRDDLSIDRIDVNAPYCPDNCRWSTTTEQSRNKTNNRIIEFNGLKLSIIEWAEKTGLAYSCLLYRLDHGWDIERALTTKSRNHKDMILGSIA